MGVRRWSLENGKVWLEGDDLEKMDLRLKEFADVALHDRGRTSKALNEAISVPSSTGYPTKTASKVCCSGQKRTHASALRADGTS